MKRLHKSLANAAALAAILAVTGIPGSGKEGGKIPITTSSQEAKQLFLKARDLQERLQTQESRQFLEQAVAKDPNFAAAYLLLAFAQSTTNGFYAQIDKAVSLADKVSEGERFWILGQDAGAKGQPMKQREYYQKLVSAYPNDERAHGQLGMNYFAQQEWDKTIQENQKAIQIAPNFTTPYNQLGYAYKAQGNYDEAEKAFKKYIELIPNDPNPYDSYAELLMKMGRFDESIAYYKKALEQNPNFVASYSGIATNLDLKGDHQGARAQLQKLNDVARNDFERRMALFGMAVSFIDEGKPEEALRKQQEQYDIGAKTNDVAAMSEDLVATGNILLEFGRVDEALAKYKQAVSIVEASNLSAEVKANTKRQNLYHSACVSLKKGDFAAAKAQATEYRRAVEAANHPLQLKQAHQLAGMIALEQKDYDKAIAELQQASFEYNPYNHYRLAQAYQGKGDRAKAREQFTKASNFNGMDGLNYAFVRAKANNTLATW
jgi:superkiller protein 3